jgi:hypothetical protein
MIAIQYHYTPKSTAMHQPRIFVRQAFLLLALFLFAGQTVHAQSTAPEDLFPIKIGNGYGYMNRAGKRIIQAHYDSARYFIQGLAAVKYNNHWGFINNLDSFVISPVFTKVRDFSEGLAAVKYHSLDGDTTVEFMGYLRTTGAYAIPLNPFIGFANDFHNGRALMQNRQEDWYYYLADKTGKIILF